MEQCKIIINFINTKAFEAKANRPLGNRSGRGGGQAGPGTMGEGGRQVSM